MTNQTISLEAQGWGAPHVVFPVSSVDLRVLPEEHPVYLAEREAIASNWLAEKTAQPSFYDGRMLLMHTLGLQDGAVSGQGHMVSFSTYLWWRRQNPHPMAAIHLHAMAVPVSSDGAIIAIRMARHTANPGMVYCAAGSLDEHDLVNGCCDIDVNMRREVLEETGLDLRHARADSQLHGSHSGRFVNLFRFFHFDRTADEILADIAEHMKTDPEQEIDGGIAIRSADLDAHRYNRAMPPMLTMFFGHGV